MDWLHKIDIKTPMLSIKDLRNVVECRQKVADALRTESKKLPVEFHEPFSTFADALELCEDIEEIDAVLENVYDFADAEAIWLG